MPFATEHHRILYGQAPAPPIPAKAVSACLGIAIATFRKRGFVC